MMLKTICSFTGSSIHHYWQGLDAKTVFKSLLGFFTLIIVKRELKCGAYDSMATIYKYQRTDLVLDKGPKYF